MTLLKWTEICEFHLAELNHKAGLGQSMLKGLAIYLLNNLAFCQSTKLNHVISYFGLLQTILFRMPMLKFNFFLISKHNRVKNPDMVMTL